MDFASLLAGTLSPSSAVRQQAEAALAQVCLQPPRQFLSFVLPFLDQYAAALNSPTAGSNRVEIVQAGCIFLKNYLKQMAWTSSISTTGESANSSGAANNGSGSGDEKLDRETRQMLMEWILDKITKISVSSSSSSSANLASIKVFEKNLRILIEILQRSVLSDLSDDEWHALFDRILLLINQQQQQSSNGDGAGVDAYLLIVRILVKFYEFKSNHHRGQDEDGSSHPRRWVWYFLERVFPVLERAMGRYCIEKQWRKMLLVIKTFWSANQMEIPPFLLADPTRFSQWLENMVTLLLPNSELFAGQQQKSAQEADELLVWKLSKWICAIMIRIWSKCGAYSEVISSNNNNNDIGGAAGGMKSTKKSSSSSFSSSDSLHSNGEKAKASKKKSGSDDEFGFEIMNRSHNFERIWRPLLEKSVALTGLCNQFLLSDESSDDDALHLLRQRVQAEAFEIIGLAIIDPKIWQNLYDCSGLVENLTTILIWERILPILQFSRTDDTTWREDSSEFIRKEIELFEDISSPRMSSIVLLTDLIKKKQLFPNGNQTGKLDIIGKILLPRSVSVLSQQLVARQNLQQQLLHSQTTPETSKAWSQFYELSSAKYGVLYALGVSFKHLRRFSTSAANSALTVKHLEDFIRHHVLVECSLSSSVTLAPLQSTTILPFEFLKYRAVWTLGTFAALPWTSLELYRDVLVAILNLFFNNNGTSNNNANGAPNQPAEQLPVPIRIGAALALRDFMRAHARSLKRKKAEGSEAEMEIARTKLFSQVIVPILPRVIETLFHMMNIVDSDEILTLLELIIESFPEEVSPLSIELNRALCQHFVNLFQVAKQEEESSQAVDYSDLGHNVTGKVIYTGGFLSGGERYLAMHGILSSITCLLTSIRVSPKIYTTMQVDIIPVLKVLLTPEGFDFLEEACDILGALTFFLAEDTFSDEIWRDVFPRISQIFDDFAYDFLPNFLVTLDNFITKNTNRFFSGWPQQPDCFVDQVCTMIRKVFVNTEAMDSELNAALQLACILVEHAPRKRIDRVLMEVVLDNLSRVQKQVASFSSQIYLLDLFAGCLFYDAELTLSFLASRHPQALPDLFKLWFVKLKDYTRIYDKKLAALGLTSILSVPTSRMPELIRNNVSHINSAVLVLIDQIALAEKEAEKREQEGDEEEEDDGDGMDASDDEDDDDDDTVISHQNRGKLESQVENAIEQEDDGEEFEIVDIGAENENGLGQDDDLENDSEFYSVILDVDYRAHYGRTIHDFSTREQGFASSILSSLSSQQQDAVRQHVKYAATAAAGSQH